MKMNEYTFIIVVYTQVGRSAKGDHLEQIRRMMGTPFATCFLLLEGALSTADGHVAYGHDENDLTGELIAGSVGVVRSSYDVCKLAAWVLCSDSCVRVLQSLGEEHTSRMLSQLAVLAAGQVRLGPTVAVSP